MPRPNQNQYDFRLTLFDSAKQTIDKFNGIYTLKEMCHELLIAERADGFEYEVVEFHAKKLTPKANKLK